jgi:type II secretory ATPase GspE/PulE/Tfp pilus assembly ATPase PilB-like protein
MSFTQAPDTSAVQLVDAIIRKAISSGASDIHCESTQNGLRIRYRIDGVLYDQEKVTAQYMPQVLSRLKVLSNINIAERRIPQDGKFTIPFHGQVIDFRVSTFPSVFGEKAVVRILDRAKNRMELENVGFSPSMFSHVKSLVSRPNGFFLVSGPTGSGKTTTLYAALAALNSAEKNIVTLEDPVEYTVAGVTQGQIHPEAGFTFEKGIRAMLRQDPDIVLIGEIRDKQTAQIAIEAALTGHLVLSTVHTNDAPAVIMRLMDMGVEPFLINAAITGVLAQRLARKICEQCKTSYVPTDEEKRILSRFNADVSTVYKGNGCNHCLGLGYKGRIGIFELLAMSSALRSLVVQQPVFDAVYAQAIADGMQPMHADGIQKVRDGIITVPEFVRVIAH